MGKQPLALRRRTGKDAAIPLVEIDIRSDPIAPPDDVRAFLDEADRRIERFQIENHIPGFVPSDFALVYDFLRTIATGYSPGNLFCEWGSGFGVVTCLAAMLDFDAHGIEIESDLVLAARQLAEDFAIPAEFALGSFIPKGSKIELGEAPFNWLTTDAAPPTEMDLELDDFNVIFAYPWPDEQWVIEDLFERHAANGALLVTYLSDENLRLQRKRNPGDAGENAKPQAAWHTDCHNAPHSLEFPIANTPKPFDPTPDGTRRDDSWPIR